MNERYVKCAQGHIFEDRDAIMFNAKIPNSRASFAEFRACPYCHNIDLKPAEVCAWCAKEIEFGEPHTECLKAEEERNRRERAEA